MKMKIKFIFGDKIMEQKSYNTRQRSQVLDCLVSNKTKHMTADDISVWLKENGIVVGKTTVYRTLEKLVSEGKARKYISEEGKSACFQYVDQQGHCEEHFHLKCMGCGKLIHVQCDYLAELERHVFEHHMFEVDNTKTVLYGVCGECRGE